ncbi:hypothetical protein D9M68_918240 [compost metagenome]
MRIFVMQHKIRRTDQIAGSGNGGRVIDFGNKSDLRIIRGAIEALAKPGRNAMKNPSRTASLRRH